MITDEFVILLVCVVMGSSVASQGIGLAKNIVSIQHDPYICVPVSVLQHGSQPLMQSD